MRLSPIEIARSIDLSCVRTFSTKTDIEEMVAAALKNKFGQVSVMQCFIPYTRELLTKEENSVRVVGNVSFPSGSDTTSLKVAQAYEMVAAGCGEIDMVMNVGFLKSGMLRETEEDVRAVVKASSPLPVKVIIEIMYLTPEEVALACSICINTGAAFVKTGTGWANRGTTLEDVRLVSSLVGERLKIKASGGIRSLDTLVEFYRAGARRFGVNLKSGIEIVQEAMTRGGVEI